MNQCAPACAPVQNTFSIFLGDAKTMALKAVYAGLNGPLDLTSCTQISVALPNADGSLTTLTLTGSQVFITSPTNLGNFTVPISSMVSALLNVGEYQNVDITFTIGSEIFTVRFYQALSVFEP